MDNNQNQPYQNVQSPQYQPPYPPQQPMYQNPQFDPTTSVMSVGQYVGMFIVNAIPVVNLIMWIVWLCSKNTNKNKKNFIIASIVIWAIGILVGIFLSLTGAFATLGILDIMS